MFRFWILHPWCRILCINSIFRLDFLFAGEIGVAVTAPGMPVTVLSINANAPGRSFPSWKAGLESRCGSMVCLWRPMGPKNIQKQKHIKLAIVRFQKQSQPEESGDWFVKGLWLNMMYWLYWLFGETTTFSIYLDEVAFKNVRSLSDVLVSAWPACFGIFERRETFGFYSGPSMLGQCLLGHWYRYTSLEPSSD